MCDVHCSGAQTGAVRIPRASRAGIMHVQGTKCLTGGHCWCIWWLASETFGNRQTGLRAVKCSSLQAKVHIC